MTQKKKPKFLRRTWSRYAKLGKGRKKKQTWRRPTGRDNKMREKRRGYPVVVSIGYKKENRIEPVLVSNVSDLDKMKKDDFIVIGAVGKKNKMEIAKKAKEKKIKISNLNPESFLKKAEKELLKKVKKKTAAKAEDKKTKKEKTEKTESDEKVKEDKK